MKNLLSPIENTLMKLTFKQKDFIYTIARLEYRIWKALTKLEIVNTSITEAEGNIASLNAAIAAAGKGKVADKLMAWKTKAEYKLFKLNLRKNKIDVVKLVINQSKLEETKQALITLEADIEKIEMRKESIITVKEKKTVLNKEIIFESWNSNRQTKEENPLNQSIKAFLKANLKMAS